MLKQGDKAPHFEGPDQNGNMVKLTDFIGKKLVLYFYPKDSTPGCTAEACDLRDNYKRFLEKGYAVLGISKDSEQSHRKFIEKYNLPFPLISDVQTSIMQSYESWGKKKFMGREFMGTLRRTFVINEQGIIEQMIDKVDTKAHTAQILK
ncbi:MAG: thioredoxin-dependent thiol peroxidase [Bacteroidales bacterium]